MNKRLKARLIIYPIVIISFFTYAALHQKLAKSHDSATQSAASVKSNSHK